jgi:putative transposase
MPKKKYLVTLTDEERTALEQMIRRGKTAARKITRARILRKAADGWGDAEIVQALNGGRATVARLRQRFLAEGLAALHERPRPGKQSLLAAKGQARLIAEACSPAPDGRECGTVQLLADRMVALGLAAACSYDTVRRVLKKTRSSRGASGSGVSRP